MNTMKVLIFLIITTGLVQADVTNSEKPELTDLLMFLKSFPVGSLSKPPRALSKWEEQQRKKFDDKWFLMGMNAPSSDIEAFVRAVQHEMGMDDYCIELRCMSQFAINMIGYENACVIGSNLGAKYHAYMYINENWFNELPQEQVKVIIGHELMHIKANHRQKKMVLGVFSCILSVAAGGLSLLYFQPSNAGDSTNVFKLTISVVAWPLVAANIWYNRYAEREADIFSAIELGCAREAVDFWKQQDEKNSFGQEKDDSVLIKGRCKRLWYSIITVIEKVFATHPTDAERADYLEKIADQQDELAMVATTQK